MLFRSGSRSGNGEAKLVQLHAADAAHRLEYLRPDPRLDGLRPEFDRVAQPEHLHRAIVDRPGRRIARQYQTAQPHDPAGVRGLCAEHVDDDEVVPHDHHEPAGGRPGVVPPYGTSTTSTRICARGFDEVAYTVRAAVDRAGVVTMMLAKGPSA